MREELESDMLPSREIRLTAQKRKELFEESFLSPRGCFMYKGQYYFGVHPAKHYVKYQIAE